MQRSLSQIQALIDQYREQGVTLGEKTELLFVSGMYPFKWQLQAELGKMYMGIGVFVSAYELFNEVELFEEAI